MPYAGRSAIAVPRPSSRYQEVNFDNGTCVGGATHPIAKRYTAEMKIETRAVHAGRRIDPATGAVAPPIYLTTTFERSAEGEYPLGFSYSREGNPNRSALEACLADLEGGKAA